MKFCPECGASLAKYMGATGEPPKPKPSSPKAYDQDAIWKALVSEAADVVIPPSGGELAERAWLEFTGSVTPTWPLTVIVHIFFDRDVTPLGGILKQAALSEGRMKLTPQMLKAAGYVLDDDKVVTKDGIPIGKLCRALDYWAGPGQFERWGMSKAISYSPTRNGKPLFMDERMAAFSVTYSGPGDLIVRSLRELLSVCENFGAECIGKALTMKLALA